MPSRNRSRYDLTWRRVKNSVDRSKLKRVSGERNPLSAKISESYDICKLMIHNDLTKCGKPRIHLFPASARYGFFEIFKT